MTLFPDASSFARVVVVKRYGMVLKAYCQDAEAAGERWSLRVVKPCVERALVKSTPVEVEGSGP